MVEEFSSLQPSAVRQTKLAETGRVGQRFIISGAEAPHVREYWLWEYDLSRPRDLGANDVRQHYEVKRLVGVYPSLPAADAALSSSWSGGGEHSSSETKYKTPRSLTHGR